MTKLEELDIHQVNKDTKVDDIYKQLKTKGDVKHKDEALQLCKVIGDDIINHIREVGDQRSKLGQNGKLRGVNNIIMLPCLIEFSSNT